VSLHNFIPYSESYLINKEGEYNLQGISINGYASFHDFVLGEERGKNIIYIISDGETKAVHLGDIGCVPDKEIMQKLTGATILFLPVGGKYTVDADVAKLIADEVNPKYIFPMHYKTDKIDFDIENEDKYLALYNDTQILRIKNQNFNIEGDTEKKIVIFEI